MSAESEVHDLMSKALDSDEAGDKETAINYYTQSVELTLKISDKTIRDRLNKYAVQALDRAEVLKGIKYEPIQSTVDQSPIHYNLPTKKSATTSHQTTVQTPITNDSPKLVLSGSTFLTETEKRVLEHTSHINDNIFVPFMNIDMNDKFVYTIPFTDKDGFLELAPNQKKRSPEWRRISELCEEPKLVSGKHVDFFSIKQTIISDCSFVASLAVAALYERRFGKRLVTSIIYPRNSKDEPIYNSSGKYTVKLHINGIPRKVIIDDYLPISRHNEMLCSYSNIRGEYWVSLLEKAYMKVMGGYDFPGSNSNIDLNALTGWIPERIPISSNVENFNADEVFERLQNGLELGRCLITAATRALSEDDQERSGLVETHAYAVLELREVDGVKLLKLKNPWSHLRWKGNYSELDVVHWTKHLQELLNYDPIIAEKIDNGVFWIDYASILRFFDVFYLNWNPALFQYTYCIHQKWNASVGPFKDTYTIGDNPQYQLTVGPGRGSVWVLLTRHITTIDDFRENKEFITLLVYQNNGNKVYYSYEPKPYIDGIRINSPHYLCKIKQDADERKTYTLVVSQYEKSTTIYYTLRAYCRDPFELKKIGEYISTEEINGEWKGLTAGGCRNHPETYSKNPKYRIELGPMENCNLVIELRGPRTYQVGLELSVGSLVDPNVTAPFVTKATGNYRTGFCVLDLHKLPAGIYYVMPSTFVPEQESPFILNFKATTGIKINRIQ